MGEKVKAMVKFISFLLIEKDEEKVKDNLRGRKQKLDNLYVIEEFVDLVLQTVLYGLNQAILILDLNLISSIFGLN